MKHLMTTVLATALILILSVTATTAQAQSTSGRQFTPRYHTVDKSKLHAEIQADAEGVRRVSSARARPVPGAVVIEEYTFKVPIYDSQAGKVFKEATGADIVDRVGATHTITVRYQYPPAPYGQK